MGRVSASGYEGLAGVVLCGLLWLVVPRGLSWQGVWFFGVVWFLRLLQCVCCVACVFFRFIGVWVVMVFCNCFCF